MEMSIPQYLKEQFHIELHGQQREALDKIEGPVLLLAVPGAGKTTVMVSRIAHMVIHCGIPAQNILTITFSKAGAVDMEERYKALFGAVSPGIPVFSTIHSFCYKVLRLYSNKKGSQMPNLLESSQGITRTAILRELYSQVNKEFLAEDVEEELCSWLSYIKNAMVTKEEAAQLPTDIHNLWQLYQDYSSYKKSHNLMDFDDMLGYAYTALRKNPDILAHFRAKYPYICLDEAQDTSKLQHQLIRLLAAPRNNLFMVGDEDQSIYRFRGAYPQHLLEFPKLYPQAQVLKMEENFRSSGSIVERARVFISQNGSRYEKNMFTQKAAGQPVEVPVLAESSQQYSLIINTYLKTPGSMAVIYRNNFSAIPLADILERNDVDFTIKDHKTALRSHYVVGDILAFFDLSFNPDNLRAFSRIFYKTSGFLRRNLLYSINTAPLAQGETWFDRALEQAGENANTGRVRYIAALINSLKRSHPSKGLEVILHSIGYWDFLEYSCGTSFSNQAHKLSVLQSLASRVKTVEEFLNRIDEMDEVITTHSKRMESRLTLTTAHSAKGLEFDTVVVLDAVEDIFPSHTAAEDLKKGRGEAMEEEARLFYVACTRARSRLIVPQVNRSAGSQVFPSRFISRLADDLPQQQADGSFAICPGMYIDHAVFGYGQIMSVDRQKGVFNAFFRQNGSRTLTMDILAQGKVKIAGGK